MQSAREIFAALPKTSGISGVLEAASTSRRPGDYIARGANGEPIWLLASCGAPNYKPPIRLRHLSVDFGSNCRVRNSIGQVSEGEFVVIACAADDTELHQFFLNVVETVFSDLPLPAAPIEVQRHIESLAELFRKLELPSGRAVKGLWAELFTICSSPDVASWLEAWHATPSDKFDFTWNNKKVEVKATEASVRIHEFSLAQLEDSQDKTLIVSILLRRTASGLDVIELAKRITSHLGEGRTELVTKLWRNVSETLGADFAENVEIRFDASFATSSMRIVEAVEIVKPKVADARVFDVRFKVDISELAERSNLTLA